MATKKRVPLGPARLESSDTSWKLTIPGLELRSEANLREHWAARARRVAAQRSAVARAIEATRPAVPELPCVVTITRVGVRLLDDDNAVGSAKHVRDEFARWVGVDDRNSAVKYLVDQRKGPPGVEIAVAWRAQLWSVSVQGDEAGPV